MVTLEGNYDTGVYQGYFVMEHLTNHVEDPNERNPESREDMCDNP